MISRTLGPEFGGAIGTLFFLANVVGSALAISGCVEGIVENFGPSGYYGGAEGLIPDSRWYRFLYCTLVNTLMLIVCLVGASLFAKANVMIFGIVIVCLMSTFISFLVQGPKRVSTNCAIVRKSNRFIHYFPSLILDFYSRRKYSRSECNESSHWQLHGNFDNNIERKSIRRLWQRLHGRW